MALDYRYHNIRSSFSYKLVLCCLTTLAVMYAHRFLPAKTLNIVPDKDVRAYIYGDTNSAGQSMASWADEKNLTLHCNIEDDGKSHVCGLNVLLDKRESPKGVDLSGYSSINVDVDYEGTDKRIRFYMRSFVDGFSDFKNQESAKYMNALIPAQFTRESLNIKLSEFFVAEWWISAYQVPREYMQPDFHNAIVFGTDLTFPTTPGLHKIKLKKLEFVGLWISAERWYLSILVFWILVIFSSGAYNLWQLKRQNRAERLRLEALINQNSALENETNHYKQLSMLDQLTGVLNRHGLSEYIQKHYPENKLHHVSLIIIDIDYFKKINDVHGHDGGDKVLHEVANIIRNNIRNTDVVSRWGGEEFVVVLPETRVEEAHFVAEKLRSMVAQAIYEELPDLHVTISLGVGGINDAEPFHQLFRRVDIALYQAKAQGRNQVVVSGSEMS